MVNSGLLISSFYIKKKFSRGEDIIYLNENKRENSKEKINVIKMLKCFMVENMTLKDDIKLMKVFSVEESSIIEESNENFSFISCIIKSGSYGIESDITDRMTQEVVYSRRLDDADIKKFRCLFYVPKDKKNFLTKKGIVIFQTIGNYGVKTLTLRYLKQYFSKFNLTFESRCISVLNFLIKIVEERKLKRISFIKNIISSDLTDHIYVNSGKEELTYINPQLKPSILKKIIFLVKSKIEGDECVIEVEDEYYEDVKLTFKVGDSQKTISILNIDKFSIVEDIPKEIYNESIIRPRKLIDYILYAINPYIVQMNMHDEIVG